MATSPPFVKEKDNKENKQKIPLVVDILVNNSPLPVFWLIDSVCFSVLSTDFSCYWCWFWRLLPCHGYTLGPTVLQKIRRRAAEATGFLRTGRPGLWWQGHASTEGVLLSFLDIFVFCFFFFFPSVYKLFHLSILPFLSSLCFFFRGWRVYCLPPNACSFSTQISSLI